MSPNLTAVALPLPGTGPGRPSPPAAPRASPGAWLPGDPALSRFWSPGSHLCLPVGPGEPARARQRDVFSGEGGRDGPVCSAWTSSLGLSLETPQLCTPFLPCPPIVCPPWGSACWGPEGNRCPEAPPGPPPVRSPRSSDPEPRTDRLPTLPRHLAEGHTGSCHSSRSRGRLAPGGRASRASSSPVWASAPRRPAEAACPRPGPSSISLGFSKISTNYSLPCLPKGASFWPSGRRGQMGGRG